MHALIFILMTMMIGYIKSEQVFSCGIYSDLQQLMKLTVYAPCLPSDLRLHKQIKTVLQRGASAKLFIPLLGMEENMQAVGKTLMSLIHWTISLHKSFSKTAQMEGLTQTLIGNMMTHTHPRMQAYCLGNLKKQNKNKTCKHVKMSLTHTHTHTKRPTYWMT